MKTQYVNSSVILLHTDEALRLCKSSTVSHLDRHFKIPSIYAFGYQLLKIWDNIKRDDPYAELSLIHVEKKLEQSLKNIELFERILLRRKNRKKLPEGISLLPCTAVNPTRVLVSDKAFHTPHAKHMLILLARYDALMRTLQSYRQFNVIRNRRYHTIKRKITRNIRSALTEPKSYEVTGVTRDDIYNKTDLGNEVTEKFGMISLNILKRKEESQYGPKLLK